MLEAKELHESRELDLRFPVMLPRASKCNAPRACSDGAYDVCMHIRERRWLDVVQLAAVVTECRRWHDMVPEVDGFACESTCCHVWAEEQLLHHFSWPRSKE